MMLSRTLAALPAVVALAVTVACGSPASTGSAAAPRTASASASVRPSAPSTTPAAATPTGFRRVGGAAQGISIAVPSSWVTVDLATQTIQQAAKTFQIKGISSSSIVQSMESLQKTHGIVVFDIASIDATSSHFATNLNAYCTSSGVNNTGSAGVPLIKQAMAGQFRKIGAQDVTQQDVMIGGVPGVQTSYRLVSSSGPVYGTQLEVLPAANKACFVTLTGAPGQFPSNGMPIVAASAQFP